MTCQLIFEAENGKSFPTRISISIEDKKENSNI